MTTSAPQDVDELLSASQALAPFKSDVLSYLQGGQASRIQVRGYAPRVKITRLLKHVLANHPELDIAEIRVSGQSGCSDFVGTAELQTTTGTKVYEFVWCCRWRAEQEGWVDYFGFPDQMRAAREFDWNCFQIWKEAGYRADS